MLRPLSIRMPGPNDGGGGVPPPRVENFFQPHKRTVEGKNKMGRGIHCLTGLAKRHENTMTTPLLWGLGRMRNAQLRILVCRVVLKDAKKACRKKKNQVYANNAD